MKAPTLFRPRPGILYFDLRWLLCALGFAGMALAKAAGTRTTVLVPLPVDPAWQDMGFLAAIPAAAVANHGAPSLIALDAAGSLTPEVKDYLRRYRPEAVFSLGDAAPGRVIAGRTCGVLKAGSADEAACALSGKFWRVSAAAVICRGDDYEAGLIAAPLAARLRVPMFFAGENGLSPLAKAELRRLGAHQWLAVGKPAGGWSSLKLGTVKVTELATARDVIAWSVSHKLTGNYLAAVNPLDRSKALIKKLSLSGALLAAGRRGWVMPLAHEVRWKVPFHGEAQPDGKSRTGRISFGGKEYAFVLHTEGTPNVSIDRNGDGGFGEPGDGPFTTGDSVELGGKRYAIMLDSDLRLTWPTAEQLADELRGNYAALGAPPEYLCLVGFPDVIPQAIFGKSGPVADQISDLPFANADLDPFAEICVARLIAENASFATLYASRALTYSALLDSDWKNRACQACWENTYAKKFGNLGFDASYHHTPENLKWLEPPAQGNPGKRARTFDANSPLTRCAALTHESHSWWQELGEMFDWDSSVLLAPTVVESGGCLTAALDRDPNFHSVVARLLRNGAVSFVGNTREGIAQGELQRQEFWNGVFAGESVGQAHRRSMNSAQMTILDRKEDAGGSYQYQLRIRALFGDPALVMYLPARPRSAPARAVAFQNRLSVHAPRDWWPVKMHVPGDWKNWVDKELFVLRGAGTYARRTWCGEQRDDEEIFLTAEFTTRRIVTKIEQLQSPPAPLGWNGSYFTDEHADGSRTYRWAVRLADFDDVKGTMINAIERIDYQITYQ